MEFTIDFFPKRIVSLVPSYTESMFDLGFGDFLVGKTDYCVYPSAGVKKIPSIGGTKTPRIGDIIQLNPDLVLANQEENTKAVVEEIRNSGIQVWVSFPKTVNQTITFLWNLVRLFKNDRAAMIVQSLEQAVELAEGSLEEIKKVRYFSPVWFSKDSGGNPNWMIFSKDTYSGDLLRLCGGENSLEIADENGTGEMHTIRYPSACVEQILKANPDLILLPDEPYNFSKTDIDQMRLLIPGVPAVKNNKIFLIDGSLITWCGTRLGKAISEIPSLLT
jgi:iron complex transport system substrate-binding protein